MSTCRRILPLVFQFLLSGFYLSAAHATHVLLPNSEPAAGATAVALATTHFLRIDGLEIQQRPQQEEVVILSGDGKLEVLEETAGRWVILHSLGYADVDLDLETETITLQPWNVLSGRVEVPGEEGARVSFARWERPRRRDEKGGSIYWTTSVEVAEDGSFSIPRVPDGFGQVGLLREHRHERRINRWREYTQATPVPQKEEITLGGGIFLRGRLDLPSEDLPALITVAPKGDWPSAHGVSDEAGNFKIPGLLPGEYRLTARGISSQSGKSVLQMDFAITEDQTEADLGTLSLESLPFFDAVAEHRAGSNRSAPRRGEARGWQYAPHLSWTTSRSRRPEQADRSSRSGEWKNFTQDSGGTVQWFDSPL